MNTQVVEIIAKVFSIDPAEVQAASGPHSIPGWDSAGHMRMIIELEDTFDIEIPDEEISRFITAGVINAYVVSVAG